MTTGISSAQHVYEVPSPCKKTSKKKENRKESFFF